jgi:hypothetical protein
MTMSQSSAGQPAARPERTTVPTVKGPEGTSAASLHGGHRVHDGCWLGAGRPMSVPGTQRPGPLRP